MWQTLAEFVGVILVEGHLVVLSEVGKAGYKECDQEEAHDVSPALFEYCAYTVSFISCSSSSRDWLIILCSVYITAIKTI